MKMLLLIAVLLTIVSNCRAEPDGLYEVSADRLPIRLLADPIDAALANSQSNDNARYQVSLQSSAPFSIPEERIVLFLSGKAQKMAGWGSDPNGHSLSLLVAADQIPAIERLYKTTVRSRRHPGHLVRVEFVPAKEKFAVGEAVVVRLRLANVGEREFTFMNGGRNRGARNNQFGFTANSGTRMLADSGNPTHFGGLAGYQTVKPGQSFELEVDLSGWFKFSEAGNYLMVGTYVMEFVDPPGPGGCTIWEDVLGAEFNITIEEAPAQGKKAGDPGK